MSTFHYTEKFYSLQAEGRYVGVPSVFLRMFGCNFRCKKFGRDKNEVIDGPNPEVVKIIENINEYKKFTDLPLVHTGCDSYTSIYTEFKRFVTKENADTLVDGIMELLPNKDWNGEHLVITGGEPLLGWQRQYHELLFHPKMSKLKELTFETNGTQFLTADFIKVLTKWGDRNTITFAVSPKLSCSGESKEDAIRPNIIVEYEKVGYTFLKLVVANHDDVNEAITVSKEYRDAGFTGPIYLMPVGGVESVYNLNNRNVADLALKHGLRYSPRLQVDLWKNEWNT